MCAGVNEPGPLAGGDLDQNQQGFGMAWHGFPELELNTDTRGGKLGYPPPPRIKHNQGGEEETTRQEKSR